MNKNSQPKQIEWFQQWSMFQDHELMLFKDWIHPLTLEDFRDKEVLEAGCGGGQHTYFIAPYAKKIVAVDLNTISIAAERNKDNANVEFIDADIAVMDLGRQFDVVISIGVVHHTDLPDKTVANLKRHVKPGGRLVLWVYSKEGNFLVEHGVEPVRRLLLRHLPRTWLQRLSQVITAALYLPVYTVYCLPLRFLPYYEYFALFRKLSFSRNVINVFDKLNAPQVQLITKKQAHAWVPSQQFSEMHVSHYRNVSWRVSGVLFSE